MEIIKISGKLFYHKKWIIGLIKKHGCKSRGGCIPPIFSCPTSANVMTFFSLFWLSLHFGQEIGRLRRCVKSSPPISKNGQFCWIILPNAQHRFAPLLKGNMSLLVLRKINWKTFRVLSNKFENQSIIGTGTQFIKGYPRHNFAGKKSKILCLKSTENQYRVPSLSLLFNKRTVISTGNTFLAKYRFRYRCYF